MDQPEEVGDALQLEDVDGSGTTNTKHDSLETDSQDPHAVTDLESASSADKGVENKDDTSGESHKRDLPDEVNGQPGDDCSRFDGLGDNTNKLFDQADVVTSPDMSPSLPSFQQPKDQQPDVHERLPENGKPKGRDGSQSNLFQDDCNENESSKETPLLSSEDGDTAANQLDDATPKNGDGLRSRKVAKSTSKDALTDSRSGDSNNVDDGPTKHRLMFGLVDTPPTHYLFFFAIQQACLAISSPLGTTAIVAQAVCAENDLDLKVKILSSTMLMMGLATFLMTTVGVKLPIFQGPSAGYIIPLIIMMSLEEFSCPETFWATDPDTNKSVLMAVMSGNKSELLGEIDLSSASNSSASLLAAASNALMGDSVTDRIIVPNRDISIGRIQAYSGSLMAAGAIHCALGLTGLLGVIARYVGPVTIVPVMLLFGIYIHTVVVMFSETSWTVAVITAATCITLGLFLAGRKIPLPVWSPGKGFRITWTFSHQIFALLIGILFGWAISFFMTIAGAFSDDPERVDFKARTDARYEVVTQTDWFILPYPGQFGTPGFSGTALISFLISTTISVLDSIGDYYATARAARTPPPPSYALNRGVAVEGAMSILSGGLGCGHATVSYSENIGAIGLSRVASRSVFQVVGIIYIALAILGKVAAIFVSIPDSVIGGTQIVTFGILIGVILSYLQVVDLKTSRNVNIIGITVLLGLMLPYWIKKSPPGTINTGYPSLDNVILVCLSNPPFLGGLFAFVLDNLVPGTLQERGIPSPDDQIYDDFIVSDGYVPTDGYSDDDEKNVEDFVQDDVVKVLVDDADVVVDDRYDVSVNAYRINWIPNCMRKGSFAKMFPVFDRRLNV